MENLYNYVFHYNNFTGLWSAIPRESYNSYWDDSDSEGVIQSKEINVLIDLIERGDEFIKSIK